MSSNKRYYLMFLNVFIVALSLIIARYYEYIGSVGQGLYIMTLLGMFTVYLFRTISKDD
jgi:hypothetical protein